MEKAKGREGASRQVMVAVQEWSGATGQDYMEGFYDGFVAVEEWSGRREGSTGR